MTDAGDEHLRQSLNQESPPADPIRAATDTPIGGAPRRSDVPTIPSTSRASGGPIRGGNDGTSDATLDTVGGGEGAAASANRELGINEAEHELAQARATGDASTEAFLNRYNDPAATAALADLVTAQWAATNTLDRDTLSRLNDASGDFESAHRALTDAIRHTRFPAGSEPEELLSAWRRYVRGDAPPEITGTLDIVEAPDTIEATGTASNDHPIIGTLPIGLTGGAVVGTQNWQGSGANLHLSDSATTAGGARGDLTIIPPRTPVATRFHGRALLTDPDNVDRLRQALEPLLAVVEGRLADPDLDHATARHLERWRDTARRELYELDDEPDPVVLNRAIAQLGEVLAPTRETLARIDDDLVDAGIPRSLADTLTGDIGKAAELAVATGDQNDTDAAHTANQLAAVVDDINNDLDAAGIEPGPDFGTRLRAFGRTTRKKTGTRVVYAGGLYAGAGAIYSLVRAVLAIFGVHLPPFPVS